MKLMDIDSDTLGIPETEYDARVTMPASEFTRIVRDLSQLGESVRIEVSKEGVRFASEGEAANGSVLLRQAEGATISGGKIVAKKEGEGAEGEGEGEGAEAEEGTSQKKDKQSKVKKEKKGDDDDVEMIEEDGDKDDEGDGEEEKDDDETYEEDEDEDGSSKKRKKKVICFSDPVFIHTPIYQLCRQTALINQLKSLELPNRKRGNLLKRMKMLKSMVSLSR